MHVIELFPEQINSVHTLTAYFCKIYFNIIIPSNLLFSKLSVLPRYFILNFVCTSRLPFVIHVKRNQLEFNLISSCNTIMYTKQFSPVIIKAITVT